MGIRDLYSFGQPSRTAALAVAASAKSNGNGLAHKANGHPTERKALTLSPSIFWLNGGASDLSTGGDLERAQAYATAALAFICIRYRAQKIREAPLMVVNETEMGEEWIKDHELAGVLARPNPDYGMARLIEATETYLCTTGRCLWVKNRDRNGNIGSLYPFSGDEFQVESGNGRLYGRFRVNNRWLHPEDVVYFGYFDPSNPMGGVAPLDAAMSHLNIAMTLQSRITAHVRNSMTPGGVYVVDKDWRSTDEEFARLKAELSVMFQGANSGKPGVAEGGGKFEKGWSLADLALGELWRETEAIVCACFGVPASLVGTVVGLENSPWSHLETAKRSFYDETILPEWELIEGVITESLLREGDADPAHLIRFDTSRIRALKKDIAAAGVTAATISSFASVNERRVMVGLPALDDPAANEVPEMVRAAMPLPAIPDQTTGEGEEADDEKSGPPFDAKAYAKVRSVYTEALREEHAGSWELVAAMELSKDADRIVFGVQRAMNAKERAPKNVRDRVYSALDAAMDESGTSWKAAVRPLFKRTAEAGVYASAVPDTGIAYRLLRPHLGSFIERESAFLIGSVTDTTKQAVRDVLREALDNGDGTAVVARKIRDLSGFSRERSRLIARTEVTRTLNGAPVEALEQYARTSGSAFIKRWSATLDDRVRDEHEAMHGEEVPIDGVFSNGEAFPSSPNCRCSVTYGLAGGTA